MRSLNFKAGAATSTGSSRADKKSVNTKSNSFINFLVGLSAVLLLAFVFIELQTPVRDNTITMKAFEDLEPESTFDVFEIIKPEPKVVKKLVAKASEPKPKVNKIKPPVIVDNDDSEPIEDPEPITEPTEPITDSEPTINAKPTKKPTVDNSPFNLLTVSEVPLYPGCNSKLDSVERVDCLNEKMARFIQRHFDTSLANDMKDKDVVAITVVFTIGTDGLPKDIRVRAPDKKLEEEAYRTISKLPKMTPGKFNGAEVNTTYALPIKFKVRS